MDDKFEIERSKESNDKNNLNKEKNTLSSTDINNLNNIQYIPDKNSNLNNIYNKKISKTNSKLFNDKNSNSKNIPYKDSKDKKKFNLSKNNSSSKNKNNENNQKLLKNILTYDNVTSNIKNDTPKEIDNKIKDNSFNDEHNINVSNYFQDSMDTKYLNMNLNFLDKEKENELLASKSLDKSKNNDNFSIHYNIVEKPSKISRNTAVNESIITKSIPTINDNFTNLSTDNIRLNIPRTINKRKKRIKTKTNKKRNFSIDIGHKISLNYTSEINTDSNNIDNNNENEMKVANDININITPIVRRRNNTNNNSNYNNNYKKYNMNNNIYNDINNKKYLGTDINYNKNNMNNNINSDITNKKYLRTNINNKDVKDNNKYTNINNEKYLGNNINNNKNNMNNNILNDVDNKKYLGTKIDFNKINKEILNINNTVKEIQEKIKSIEKYDKTNLNPNKIRRKKITNTPDKIYNNKKLINEYIQESKKEERGYKNIMPLINKIKKNNNEVNNNTCFFKSKTPVNTLKKKKKKKTNNGQNQIVIPGRFNLDVKKLENKIFRGYDNNVSLYK